MCTFLRSNNILCTLILAVVIPLGVVGCSDTVTDIEGAGGPKAVTAPSDNMSTATVCSDLAIGALGASKDYTSAARGVKGAASKDPESPGTVAALDVAIAAFAQLSNAHEAMLSGCGLVNVERDRSLAPTGKVTTALGCSDLAVEALKASRGYTRAARGVKGAASKDPASPETLAALQVAIAAFGQLSAAHQAMVNGCGPLSVDGDWNLDPALVFSCPFIPAGFGDVSVSTLKMLRESETQLRISILFSLGAIPAPHPVQIIVPYDASTRSFDGSGNSFFGTSSAFTDVTYSLSGMFTGADTFEAHIVMDLFLDVTYLDFAFAGQCDPVDAMVTGTRAAE